MKAKRRWWFSALILHVVALAYSFVGNTAGYWGWGGLEGALGVSFSYSAYERARGSVAAAPKAAGDFILGCIWP